MTVLIDGVNGIDRNFFYKQLPFAIRGTKDWDNREKMRKKIGDSSLQRDPRRHELGGGVIRSAEGSFMQLPGQYRHISRWF